MPDRKEKYIKALNDEENHYALIRRVFGTADGLDALEWLLVDLCGYWRSRFDTEREFGKFELGRFVFNQICVADIDIAHNLLDRQRKRVEAVRNDERKKIESRKE